MSEVTNRDRLRILAAFAPLTEIVAVDLEAMTVTVRLPKPLKYHSVPFVMTAAGIEARGEYGAGVTVYRPEIVCALVRGDDGGLRLKLDEQTGEIHGYMRPS